MYNLFFYLSILIVAVTATQIAPRDLADEALEQLEELKSLIQGDILEAHNNLDTLQSGFEIYASQVLETGAISLDSAKDYVDHQVVTLETVGNRLGVDYSTCMDVSEETLASLPDTYSLQMSQCIGAVDLESAKLIGDATYIIDVTYNYVYAIEQHLQSCGTDLLCISPIVNEIQLYKVSIPQSIANEVQNAEETLAKLQSSAQYCSDNSVIDYRIAASAVISEMSSCIFALAG